MSKTLTWIKDWWSWKWLWLPHIHVYWPNKPWHRCQDCGKINCLSSHRDGCITF